MPSSGKRPIRVPNFAGLLYLLLAAMFRHGCYGSLRGRKRLQLISLEGLSPVRARLPKRQSGLGNEIPVY
jgi:hypothetical protein